MQNWDAGYLMLGGMWVSVVFAAYNSRVVIYLRRKQRVKATPDRKQRIATAAVWGFRFMGFATTSMAAMIFHPDWM